MSWIWSQRDCWNGDKSGISTSIAKLEARRGLEGGEGQRRGLGKAIILIIMGYHGYLNRGDRGEFRVKEGRA